MLPIRACILVETRPGAHTDVVSALKDDPRVKAVFPTLGRVDVVLNVHVENRKELTEVIAKINDVEGQLASDTLLDMEV